jgi:hypothetical protein
MRTDVRGAGLSGRSRAVELLLNFLLQTDCCDERITNSGVAYRLLISSSKGGSIRMTSTVAYPDMVL